MCIRDRYFASGSASSFNALKVFGGAGQHSVRAASPDWVSWPPEGFVPHDTVYDRWSLSLNASPGADFSAATITMTEAGSNVPIQTVEPISNGFCDNTLVWVPDLVFTGSAPDRTITVTVSNIMVNGQPTTHSYDVTVIEANACPAPVNDNFAAATPLGTTFSATVTGTNECATGELPSSAFSPSPPLETVWYSWTAPATGTVTATTCSAATNFDTDITLATGQTTLIGYALSLIHISEPTRPY